jgi:hypothetical protein
MTGHFVIVWFRCGIVSRWRLGFVKLLSVGDDLVEFVYEYYG